MFSYDDMRGIIAEHLSRQTNQARALDTAIMAACRAAFEAGRHAGAEEILSQETNVPDITLCTAEDCPLADNCYRATAKPSPDRQAWADFTVLLVPDPILGTETCPQQLRLNPRREREYGD